MGYVSPSKSAAQQEAGRRGKKWEALRKVLAPTNKSSKLKIKAPGTQDAMEPKGGYKQA